MSSRLTYHVVTAARDEEHQLPRLAESLVGQSVLPERWTIVENGSNDATAQVAGDLSARFGWIRLIRLPGSARHDRGAPIVAAIHRAVVEVESAPDVLVNVDADVSMESDYFERLLGLFAATPDLGIASGSAWEREGGEWKQRFVTGGTVWGATRAYRWECLQDVLPLKPRHGWDGIDQIQARARGWSTLVDESLPFLHHRPEGTSDGSRWSHWRSNGETAYFMGYRPSYLLARVAHHARRDPAAVAMMVAYGMSFMTRAPRLDDAAAVSVLRDDQRLRHLVHRRQEASGRAADRAAAHSD